MLISAPQGKSSTWNQVRSENRNLTRLYSENSTGEVFYGPGASIEITDWNGENPGLAIYIGSNVKGSVYLKIPEKFSKICLKEKD